MKLNTRKGGFTLVEIMIVVAIIALLASIAVPNFMRARIRSQASLVKDDLRVIDSAKDQWAIEYNKKDGEACDISNLKGYFKESTPLYTGKDLFGGSYTIGNIGVLPTMDAATKTEVDKVTEKEFWSPYNQ